VFLRTSTYIKWLKIWGTLPIIPWVKAAQAYRDGKFKEAADLYEDGIKRYPEHPARFSARLDCAFCLQRLQKFSECEEHLRHVTTHAAHLKEGFLRLARLQVYTGKTLEAVWTMRRLHQRGNIDGETAGLFLNLVLDNQGPGYLLHEAIDLLKKVPHSDRGNVLLRAACAKLAVYRGSVERGLNELSKLAESPEVTAEIVIIYAETLLSEKQISASRYQLRRVLNKKPNHPIVLSLLARTYLESGIFFDPEAALDLATSACQANGWLSPRELHTLAESYHHYGDKAAALLAASKARDLGSKLLGSYRNVRDLDELIEALSTQTLM
jgi:tetratricopeptide (TPR) repeat protein